MVLTNEVPKPVRKLSMIILALELILLGLIIVWANRVYLGETLQLFWAFLVQTWQGLV